MAPAVLTIEKPGSSSYTELLSLAEKCPHPHFWFHDGDTIIQAQNVYFRVHSAQIVPLSRTLQSIFGQVSNSLDSRDLYFIPDAKGGQLAWSCLLGLIYSKEEATANPSFFELLAMIRVTMIYQFTRIHTWALASMRRSFFRSPEHVQVDWNETMEENLGNAIQVFQAWWFPRLDLNNRTLAIYALARLDPDSRCLRQLRQAVPLHTWQIIEAAREAMTTRYDEIISHVANIGLQDRESLSHCPTTCRQCLIDWMEYARDRDSDVLIVLRQLKSEMPSGPICLNCINDVHVYLDEAYKETSYSLPLYTGCHGLKAETWDVNPMFLNTNLLLSGL